MRVAWIGQVTKGGGVGGFGRMLVDGLLQKGIDLSLFAAQSPEDIRDVIGEAPNLTVVTEEANWQWNRWYSRHPAAVFISSFASRAAAYKRLVKRVVQANRAKPFDVILQFSQTEIFSMARHLKELPRVVLFPCVHAAGELRWHRRESSFALQSEPWWRHRLIRANLVYRARKQRQALSQVYGQIGMSRRFNELMRQDYGVNAERQAVVYQPMPSQRPPSAASQATKIKLMFVGRISVRKGIDLLIDVSHRLDDLAEQVEMEVIGGPSFWSDYTRNLSKLNPRLARYVGAKPHDEIMKCFAEADLLLVPSQYEPGGIVVAEALSQGCRVVVSDEVGSAEPLSDQVCYRFPAGELDAFEKACRRGIADSQTRRDLLREGAMEEAATRFGTEQAINGLLNALASAAAKQPLHTGAMTQVTI